MTEKLVKKDAKTLRRWDVKFKSGNKIGGDADGLSSLPTLPSLIREGNAPILMTDFDDLRHDSFPDKNLTTYRLIVLTSSIKPPRHSEAGAPKDPSLSLRMTVAEESPLKIFNFPFSIFHLKNSQFKKAAFTLAEVLITLGVIGVVAAMTMPVLINHIKDQQYDRARQKALASIGEAGRLIAIQGDMGAAANAEDFVKNILSKKLSIAKMCDADHLSDCGWASEITVLGKGRNFNGDKTISPPKKLSDIVDSFQSGSSTLAIKDSPSYGFVTANGYSVNLFYNPNCTTDTNNDNGKANDYVCMNAIYDMNGKANPNEVGKDIGFVTVLYPDETNRAVAPNPVASDISGTKTWTSANAACNDKGYSLPDKEELQSLAYNSLFTNLLSNNYWSGSVRRGQVGQAWYVYTRNGHRCWRYLDSNTLVRCVRR